MKVYQNIKKISVFSMMGRSCSLQIILMFFIIVQCGCKKLVEVDSPITSINGENVYATNSTAAAVLTNIYAKMSNSSFPDGGITSLSLFPGLSADELTLYNLSNTTYLFYYRNALTNASTSSSDFWNAFYPVIFVANSAIEGLRNSTTLTVEVKKQLLGEALFVRAFCYFYLVNLYGPVPLTTSTDYKVNALLFRSSKENVNNQIIADLIEAQDFLSDKYLKGDALTPYTGMEERVRPTKWAAKSLLARVYLYNGNWANAEVESSAVINNTALFDTTSVNKVFLKNSKEAIWQLQPVRANQNTQDAKLFILPSSGPGNSGTSPYPIYLSTSLVNSFEVNDLRKTNWVGSVTPAPPGTSTFYFAYKYKLITGTPVDEYLMVLRLSEQYLIRAEARAQLNNISGSQNDLNVIRKRAKLSNTIANDKSSLLTAIWHERQVELFTEWGHRWLDLQRTGNIDAVMNTVCTQKGGVWNSNWSLYPIPLSDLQKNPNLIQNAGY